MKWKKLIESWKSQLLNIGKVAGEINRCKGVIDTDLSDSYCLYVHITISKKWEVKHGLTVFTYGEKESGNIRLFIILNNELEERIYTCNSTGKEELLNTLLKDYRRSLRTGRSTLFIMYVIHVCEKVLRTQRIKETFSKIKVTSYNLDTLNSLINQLRSIKDNTKYDIVKSISYNGDVSDHSEDRIQKIKDIIAKNPTLPDFSLLS